MKRTLAWAIVFALGAATLEIVVDLQARGRAQPEAVGMAALSGALFGAVGGALANFRATADSGNDSSGTFIRFTYRARKAMRLAEQEAERFHHAHLGTEHVLLGLIEEGSGVAAHLLKNLPVGLPRLRLEVEKRLEVRPAPSSPEKRTFTPQLQGVLAHALEQSEEFGRNYVGTDHLLLGLLREDGIASAVLRGVGLTFISAREAIVRLLGYSEEGFATVLETDEEERLELPVEARHGLRLLDEPIEYLDFLKEEAVVNMEWERAAQLLQMSERLKSLRREFLGQWLKSPDDRPAGGTA